MQFLMYYIICTCILYNKQTHIIICTHTNTLEKEMATHSSTLAWKIPWTEEPGGPQSTGSQGVGHNCPTEQIQYRYMCTHTHTHTHTHTLTSVYILSFIYSIYLKRQVYLLKALNCDFHIPQCPHGKFAKV